MCAQFVLLLLIVFAYCIYIFCLHNGGKLTRREIMSTSDAPMYAVRSGGIEVFEVCATSNSYFICITLTNADSHFMKFTRYGLKVCRKINVNYTTFHTNIYMCLHVEFSCLLSHV